jgi:hypothetical protein
VKRGVDALEEVISRCGMRCDLCLAYTPNRPDDLEELQRLSDAWEKYFGFQTRPEDLQCDGCWAEGGRLLDKDCPVRPCVIERGLDNCAQCEDYICGRLEQRLGAREEIENRLGVEIPEDEYQLAIRPYENKKRLEALRAEGQGER